MALYNLTVMIMSHNISKHDDTLVPRITPAMLAAGVDVIAEKWGVCGEDIAPELAYDVFNAMWAAINLDPEKSFLNF